MLRGGLVEVSVQGPLESQREHWVPEAEIIGSSGAPKGDPGAWTQVLSHSCAFLSAKLSLQPYLLFLAIITFLKYNWEITRNIDV